MSQSEPVESIALRRLYHLGIRSGEGEIAYNWSISFTAMINSVKVIQQHGSRLPEDIKHCFIRVFRNKAFMISTNLIFSLVLIILGSQGIALQYRGALATTTSDIHSNMIIDSNSKNTIQKNNILVTKILAKNLENHLQKAGAILEITSKLPQVRNVSYAHLLNQTLNIKHGIPQLADIEKRQVAKNMLSSNSDFQIVIFIMPNGDIYLDEPYLRQQLSKTTNLAFRDYKEVIRINDIYLGDPIISVSSGQMQSVIAIPVYSLKDNSTIAGVWAGGIDFAILNKELQSLDVTSSLYGGNNTRIVYVGHNGQKIADSDINKSKTPESFATLNSFKNAVNGQSGSIIDTVNNTKTLVTYEPAKVFHNTWVVLLMQPLPPPK